MCSSRKAVLARPMDRRKVADQIGPLTDSWCNHISRDRRSKCHRRSSRPELVGRAIQRERHIIEGEEVGPNEIWRRIGRQREIDGVLAIRQRELNHVRPCRARQKWYGNYEQQRYGREADQLISL